MTIEILEAAVNATSAALKAFPRGGPLGLTPDAVKASPEWKAARNAYQSAFDALRAFNAAKAKARRA